MGVVSLIRNVGTAGSYPNFRRAGGRAGLSADLGVADLRAAYAKGLYPAGGSGRQTWCAPAERMVLFIENFHIEPAVRRRLARKHFTITFDQDFPAVLDACAGHRNPAIVETFTAAFDVGLAHSVEVRDRSGALAGGIFGLAIGRIFFTEGHFAWTRDASKIGFTALNCHLQRWGYLLNDAKHLSGRLCQLGFLPIRRATFDALLAMACTRTGQEGRWAVDRTINLATWNPKAMSAFH